MPRSYRAYTDEDIVNASKEVFSLSGLLVSLGLRPVGSNHINMKRNLQRLDVNTDHWTGQGWNKDQQLKDYSDYTSFTNVRKHVLKKWGNVCQRCGIREWNGEPITLEVDHEDGDRTNNDEMNLVPLCPNCHSQTDTWRNRKAIKNT